MCTCETTSNIHLKILAAKAKIKELFQEYGIAEPVTIENVELALEEEAERGTDFEHKLTQILDKVQLKNNAGDDLPSKNDLAMSWVNTITGAGSNLANSIIGAKNPATVNHYYPNDANTGDNGKTLMYVIIAIVVVIVIATVLYLMNRSK